MVETGWEAEREPEMKCKVRMATLQSSAIRRVYLMVHRGSGQPPPDTGRTGRAGIHTASFELMATYYEQCVFLFSAINRRVCLESPLSETLSRWWPKHPSPPREVTHIRIPFRTSRVCSPPPPSSFFPSPRTLGMLIFSPCALYPHPRLPLRGHTGSLSHL